ncbi:hypothetical protein PLICRDRAFT_178765 [Plicaturopsis crispa FD-325 SS-3]|nr:hypothetical protein PLICRDRAFT_178765 [Plicaturopsis crispa FD-325 SS-3]
MLLLVLAAYAAVLLQSFVVSFIHGRRDDLTQAGAGEGSSGYPNNPLFIDMPIDHWSLNASGSTFKNRYWVNDTYYDPTRGGPVFIFDSGEQNAEPLLPYYLQEYHGLSATMQLAKRYGGVAILWEHRYYGVSLPFPVNENTTADEWQFLTTEQALEDVVFFANSFPTSSNGTSTTILHPSITPWIWLGGSYPGVRGAHMRVRNPEIIYATWASSAPVHSQVDMVSYYEAAERSLTRNCSADWVAVTEHVDKILKGANNTAKIELKYDLLRARMSGPGGNTSSAANLTMQQANLTGNVDAASILMDPLNFYQYYGFAASVLPFCELLETQNQTAIPVEQGLNATYGIEDALRAFLDAIAELDYDSVPPGPPDPTADFSWMYQYCSEYGFYQRGDPNNPLSIETSFLSLDYFQAGCNESFKGLPPSPQVDHVNKYGGWNMTPSNVLFTNGEFDPWRTMGLASIEPESPKRNASVIVPPCNTPPPGTDFFGLTHAN